MAELPARHLSIRVPWHDTAWDGRVCADPARNTSCLILKKIAEDRDDVSEACVSGRRFAEIDESRRPPCISEHAGILAADRLVRRFTHPYKHNNPALYSHFGVTEYTHHPYSAACVPYRWMLRAQVTGEEDQRISIVEEFGIEYSRERESVIDARLGFSPNFVNDVTNQRLLLDAFFDAVSPDESLCFFYAKRTPLAESSRRILVGVGRVTAIGPSQEYNYLSAPRDGLRSMVWERDVFHSVRPEGSDGFMLPYQRVLELARSDDGIDPEHFVAFAPDEAFASFSYGTEHVSDDHAIAALLAFVPVLERLAKTIDGPFIEHLAWVDRELGRLWKLRGPFPGMGAALCALGVPRGNLMAWRIAAQLAEQGTTWSTNPWDAFGEALNHPSSFGAGLRESLGAPVRALWNGLRPERRALLLLLSRFDLTAAQARRFYEPADREAAGISVSDVPTHCATSSAGER